MLLLFVGFACSECLLLYVSVTVISLTAHTPSPVSVILVIPT